MIYHIGQEKGGRIKFTTDVDCLSPQIVKYTKKNFQNRGEVLLLAEQLWKQGHETCVDDEVGLVELEH